jgi:CBS domain-containing protein
MSALLKRALIDAGGQSVGRLADVIVRLRGAAYPEVTGLVVEVRGRRMFVPAPGVTAWDTDRLVLASAKVDIREFERRPGEVLLQGDVLGHRVLDLESARLVRAYDVQLREAGQGWEAAALDVHPTGRLRLPGRHDRHAVRDWSAFELLTDQPQLTTRRTPRAWLRRLKPADIADVLEDASDAERTHLLSQVHGDPELEADVFEELDEGEQSELFALKTDEEVAGVVARMRADDAADAIMELPPERREPVLDGLPPEHRTKVMTLLGYHAASAGGLMGVEFLALAADCTVEDALAQLREAGSLQWEALTSVYCVDQERRLRGAATIVEVLQADPSSLLGGIGDADPVRVPADTDILDLTLIMADHNLLTLPVVDDGGRLVGLITVDDVLEASIPASWRRREPPRRSPHTENARDPSPSPRTP